MKKRTKLLLIIGAVLLVIVLLVVIATNDSKAAFKCYMKGGVWTGFSNTCVDSCTMRIDCGEVITSGCDCGEDRCWNGVSCEEN